MVAFEVVYLQGLRELLQQCNGLSGEGLDVVVVAKKQIEVVAHQEELRGLQLAAFKLLQEPQKSITVVGVVGVGDEEGTFGDSG